MKILFQGDSITDCGRSRSDVKDIGPGYPSYVKQYLEECYPQLELELINKGIGGHQTKDLVARWQEDAIDIQPDVISILVGVNDTWHHADKQDWIPNDVFEANYRSLLEDIKNKTNAKIIMLEQFVLDFPDMRRFHNDIDEKIQIVRRLASEYADRYIPLDGLFAAACVAEPPSYWTEEGVHPTDEGHRLIADYYFDALSDIIEESFISHEGL
ncbi:MAG: SGNH/GDSL hydrolase family protein [Clostridia bacterium]|nr:SGNH/GDSL hydrolase family protein [Clostridia bacterium]